MFISLKIIIFKYSEVQIFISRKKDKHYVDKQYSEQDRKGNKCENTCIFPNGGYNQAMNNGAYQELWNPNQRSLYD